MRAALHRKPAIFGLTVGEERLGQLPEEGFQQAADDVQVLPPLRRHREVTLSLQIQVNRLLREGFVFYFMSHLLGRVDVQALVEMLLQVGHHGVVARHAVDARVLQAGGFDHAAAHLHDQRDKLRGSGRTRHVGRVATGQRGRREASKEREGRAEERGEKVENYKVRVRSRAKLKRLYCHYMTLCTMKLQDQNRWLVPSHFGSN